MVEVAGVVRIVLITGSYPPMRCGIGDYTFQLVGAMRNAGVEAAVLTSAGAGVGSEGSGVHPVVRGWGIWRAIPVAIRVCRHRPHLVHVQYPTLGYGYRLGPHALVMLLRTMGVRVISTIHEFREAHPLRKLGLVPFFLWSNALVFTAEEERAAVANTLPLLRRKLERKAYVIPVGSNIPVTARVVKSSTQAPVASYFGLFYPGRQVEVVVRAFSKMAEVHPTVTFRFIGDVHPYHRAYFDEVRRVVDGALPRHRVEWVLGKRPEEISVALAESDVCLLPYPDGASFRRTTLIAALSTGVAVITTKGDSTPRLLAESSSVLFAKNEDGMARMLLEVLGDPALARRIGENGRALSKRFSWDQIVEAHLTVYERVTS